MHSISISEEPFFTYNTKLNHLRLYYTTSVTSYPNQSLTFDFASGIWTYEVWGSPLQGGISMPSKLANWVLAARAPVITGIYEAQVLSTGTLVQLQTSTSATSDYGGSTPVEIAGFGDARWTYTVIFVILILILVFRPSGLLGEEVPEGQ